jgi:hypothetical protein
MVAPRHIPLREVIGGGKSELHRAGWSVMRTVPEFCVAEFGSKESATEKNRPDESRDKGEKVR